MLLNDIFSKLAPTKKEDQDLDQSEAQDVPKRAEFEEADNNWNNDDDCDSLIMDKSWCDDEPPLLEEEEEEE